jgi:hypothetical protein
VLILNIAAVFSPICALAANAICRDIGIFKGKSISPNYVNYKVPRIVLSLLDFFPVSEIIIIIIIIIVIDSALTLTSPCFCFCFCLLCICVVYIFAYSCIRGLV